MKSRDVFITVWRSITAQLFHKTEPLMSVECSILCSVCDEEITVLYGTPEEIGDVELYCTWCEEADEDKPYTHKKAYVRHVGNIHFEPSLRINLEPIEGLESLFKTKGKS